MYEITNKHIKVFMRCDLIFGKRLDSTKLEICKGFEDCNSTSYNNGNKYTPLRSISALNGLLTHEMIKKYVLVNTWRPIVVLIVATASFIVRN